jgi:hypothetical protein
MRLGLSAIAVIGVAWASAAAAQPGEGQAPIPGAGAWMIASPGQAIECTARVNGPQIDTMLTANNDGKMVLVAGRADWNNPGTTATASLQIDGKKARKVSGSYVANLYLVLVADDGLLKDLEGARQLSWTFKIGKFQADVTGLGTAFEAVRACKASLPASPPTQG